MLFVLYNNDLVLSLTTGGLSGLRCTFSLGFSQVVDITWQLDLSWMSKMAHSLAGHWVGLDSLAKIIDQIAYLQFLHITWTSHRMTTSSSWYSNRQKQLEAASLLKPGLTQLPFSYIILGSCPDSRRGDKIPLSLFGKSVKGFVAIFNHTFFVSPNQGLWDSLPIPATAVLISSIQVLTHFADTTSLHLTVSLWLPALGISDTILWKAHGNPLSINWCSTWMCRRVNRWMFLPSLQPDGSGIHIIRLSAH